MSRWPEPGWQVPRNLSFASDGRELTFLQGKPGSDELALYALDLGTKQTRLLLSAADLNQTDTPLSREEELRRERQRQRARGISDYSRASRSPLLVIPQAGDVYVRKADGKVARLTRTPEPELDAKPCATGQNVAYVRGGELFVTDVASGRETQLTRGAVPGITHGQSDFNGQEELDEPSGYFWSPTCDRIAYLEVDERQVAELPIAGYRDGRADVSPLRYPRAGQTNPTVRIKLVELSTRRSVDVATGAAGERYFARFEWTHEGKQLLFQTLTRDQKRRELLVADANSGKTRTLASETSAAWVEFREARHIEGTGNVVWLRDIGGFRHLELLDLAGKLAPRALTHGEYDVLSIGGVDAQRGKVFVTTTRESPLERQLYAVSLRDASEPVRITQGKGTHSVTVGASGAVLADVYSSLESTPRVTIRSADGAELARLDVPLDADFQDLALQRPESFQVKGPSGDTLYGQLLKPRNLEPGRRYPLVLMVYGGPSVQTIQDRWSARLSWQHLADRGVVVAQLDNRGTPGRGRAFEHAIYGKFGQIELPDQLAGVDYLTSLPFVDGARIGIYGHSYGGYVALLGMLKYPERFKVGVAGSPAGDFTLYDSGYTERYLGTPAQHADWFAAANPEPLVSQLRGKLLVVHALMDENVHFAGTAKLIDAFAASGKPFDLLVFPGERHGYRNPAAKRYAWQRVLEYLTEHL